MSTHKEELIFSIQAIEEKYFRRNERDFTYELYHKLRELKLQIDITAETPKDSNRIPENLMSLSFFKENFFTSENYDVQKNNYNRTPDLLFHEFDTRRRQLLACEVKPLNQRNSLIKKDLAKLLYYTESDLSYERGILILITQNENERKLARLRGLYENFLINFPKIEIWIVQPKRVHIVWADGKAANKIH